MDRNMQLIGLIGGTSWHSTIVYYRRINEIVGKEIGAQGNPPLLLYSQNIELMRRGDKEEINRSYLEVAQKLQAAGAKAILICANTPHLVYPYVAPRIDIPILHIADATGMHAQKLGLQKLGLLGNRPTMTGNFIKERLMETFGIETMIPEAEYLDKAHYYVSKELTRGIFSAEARAFFLEQMELLKKRGAEGVILGCTELPMLIKQEDFDLPLMDTTELHIQMASNFILSKSFSTSPIS